MFIKYPPDDRRTVAEQNTKEKPEQLQSNAICTTTERQERAVVHAESLRRIAEAPALAPRVRACVRAALWLIVDEVRP